MTGMPSARAWAVAAVASACLLTHPGVAAADPLPAGCTQTDAAGPVTCVYTSGTNELLLPEGVTSVTVTAIGGRGGNLTRGNSGADSGAGGRGAEVTGTVAVPSGTRTLYAVVGGNGTSTEYGTDPTGGAGGANGGGAGGTGGSRGFVEPGAGGGGASDLRTVADDLGARLVVAAGGGGGIAATQGGDAGAPGRYLLDGGTAAQAGSDTAGGAGGSDPPTPDLATGPTGFWEPAEQADLQRLAAALSAAAGAGAVCTAGAAAASWVAVLVVRPSPLPARHCRCPMLRRR